MQKRILIRDCTLLTDAAAPLRSHHFVTIEGPLVSSLGPMANCPDPEDFCVLEGQEKLVMPGLINGHNHAAMTLFRGFADDLSLHSWLHEHIFPAEAAHVKPEMVYWSAKLAAAEMISSGTTCVADGYFYSNHAARAFSDAGLRAVVGHGIVDFSVPSVPDPTKNIETVAQFIDQWLGQDQLICPAVFAHSPYTCSPATLVRAKQLADDKGVRFFIHLAESPNEQQQIIDPQSSSPTGHLAALGLLDSNCTCIHTVWLHNGDISTLADHRVGIVTCPQSNAKLGSGIAPVAELIDKGAIIGLGTDGCASNNSLDLFREMDMLAKLQKLYHKEATALSARQVIDCATASGARAIGLESVGSILPGRRADLLLIDMHQPHLVPFYNQDTLVYGASGSDVDSVIVEGRLIMHEKKILTFDLDEVIDRVRNLAERVVTAT
ncbi:MAG: amidohydrolase [Desulfofustis sp.]|nr:amidohydrolase [Desulfofustis sp.]